MIAPGWGILLVLGTLGALMSLVRALQQRRAWPAEWSRKSVHLIMGMICMTFPALFHENWPVWVLAGGAVVGLGALRVSPALRHRFGSVLSGVQRESWGELLFPLSVAFLFWLAHGQALFFRIPVLTLTLADATAALIGQRYGIARYETDDGWKSVEGSTAFFIIAFLATHVLLLLGSSVGRLECLLIATVMGLILMLMEAIAWRGLDNLFVPLTSYACLVRLSGLGAADLTVRLGVLVALTVALCFCRKATRLTQSAAIGAALVLYVAWAVGDIHWLIAPLVTAVAYALVCAAAKERSPHTVHAIAVVGGLGLAWLCLAQVLNTVNTIYAYGIGYASNLAIIALAYLAGRFPAPVFKLVIGAALLAYVPLAIPYLFVWRANHHVAQLAAGALLLVGLAAAAFATLEPSLRPCPTDRARWVRQGVVAAVASALGFTLISLLEPWSTSFP
jgi:phytol kinase